MSVASFWLQNESALCINLHLSVLLLGRLTVANKQNKNLSYAMLLLELRRLVGG